MKRIDTSDLTNNFSGRNTIVKAHGKFRPALEGLFAVAVLTATMIVPSEAKHNQISEADRFVAELSDNYTNGNNNSRISHLDEFGEYFKSDQMPGVRTPTGKLNINQDYLNNISKIKNNELGM